MVLVASRAGALSGGRPRQSPHSSDQLAHYDSAVRETM